MIVEGEFMGRTRTIWEVDCAYILEIPGDEPTYQIMIVLPNGRHLFALTEDPEEAYCFLSQLGRSGISSSYVFDYYPAECPEDCEDFDEK